MNDINNSLDHIRSLLMDPDFLNGKGLSNEVNIRIFCYKPEDEMTVRNFVNQIMQDKQLPCHLVNCNLYETFLELCRKKRILDKLPDMESRYGTEGIIKKLADAITVSDYGQVIRNKDLKPGDVLMITGVGDAFPFMRVHTLLDKLASIVGQTPILVMYPGEFNGRFLKLFNILTPNPYYRAFNVI